MAKSENSVATRIPVREGFFTEPLSNLDDVRLKGTRCRACGEVFLGRRVACEACLGSEMEDITLSDSGRLYTYTIIRYRPPGAYKGPDPHVPFAVGLVELPEQLRVMSRLTDCEFDRLEVGMPLKLVVAPFYIDEQGREVISYSFKPA
ncbi:MAG: Zn-ribbon domain-containing OB-fold protein [Chloroflexota bacterium]